VVNRFMALRPGQGELRRARAIAIGWAVLVYCGMIVTGLAGRVLFPDLADGEVVFLTTSNQLLHPVAAGVMLAAVLSAIMSTADSQLLVAASSVTHDLRPGHGTDLGFLRGSRAVVLLLSLAAVAAALVGPTEIFAPVLVAWSAMGAAFGPVLLVRVLRGPVSAARTLVAMSSGLVLTIAGALLRTSVAGDWGGAAERVLPFAVALAIAATGPRAGADQPAAEDPGST
jgi:sodium/proline symporter